MITNNETIRVFVNQKTGIVTRSIFDLSDVDLSGIANNEVLVYDGSVGKIVPSDVSTILSVGLEQVDGGVF